MKYGSLSVAFPDDNLEEARAELEVLKRTLVDRELALKTEQAELRRFETEYATIIGTRYAKLDVLRSRVAELLHLQYPNEPDIADEAHRAHERAKESSQRARVKTGAQSLPTDTIKQLYRRAAKRIHPDFAVTEPERKLRTRIMIQLNQAYRQGDEVQIQQIIDEWDQNKQLTEDGHEASELTHITLQLFSIRQRLAEIDEDLSRLRSSDLYKIKLKADHWRTQGRDLLEEMAAELDKELLTTQQELQALRE